MKLHFLGSGASEGWPAMFCPCDHCKRARDAGGKNIRSRTQALIDGTLCLDLPPDTFWHITQNNLQAWEWTGLLITHSHNDHFAPAELTFWFPPFSHSGAFLEIYGNEEIVSAVSGILARRDPEGKRMSVREVANFTPFSHGKYKITPLPADHDKSQNCHIYIVEDGQSRMLYGNDTGFFKDEVWAYIDGMRFDLVSLDCTHGLDENRYNHMSLSVCHEVKTRMLASGCDEKTQFVLHHFSHNGEAIHDELVPIAANLGFLVSYDGMVITF